MKKPKLIINNLFSATRICISLNCEKLQNSLISQDCEI